MDSGATAAEDEVAEAEVDDLGAIRGGEGSGTRGVPPPGGGGRAIFL